MVLSISEEASIYSLVEQLPHEAIIEDRSPGGSLKHYRAIIVPPYKLVYDVVRNKLKTSKIRLRGYTIQDNQKILEYGIKLMHKINAEALLYERIRKVRCKLFSL